MPNCARLIRSAWLRLAVALLPALAGAPVAAQTGEKPAVAIGADLASQAGTTRLTLTLSRAVEARGFVMERPDRAVIDLPEVNFQLDSGTGSRRDGLVQSFRYGLFAPGRSRIVIDLTAPATVGKIETATRPRDASDMADQEAVSPPTRSHLKIHIIGGGSRPNARTCCSA